MFTFLSPIFLVGLLSAAIPLLIHLSRSRRTKKIQFSTTRFLTDQFLRSYRMSRLKELLLLAVRMALCALFVFALARPLLLPKGQSVILGQSRSVVFVLDDSASMGLMDEGRTLLAKGQQVARDLLGELKPGDTASVVLAGRRAHGSRVLFAEPTTNLTDVRQAIDAVTVAALGTDLSGAVRQAEDVLKSSTAQSREIYVLSDLQDSGWQLPDEKSTTAKSDSLVFFVRLRQAAAENLAVTAVQYATSRPMVGIPFVIRPHVRNAGQQVRDCTASLFVDGKKVGEQEVKGLQPGRWSVPRFHHTFDKGGWHNGYVELNDESLVADNRRHFAFQVLDSVKLLAVNGAPSSVPRLDELFFLRLALSAASEGASPIQVDTISTAGLADKDLTSYPLVLLANVESLSQPVVEKLEKYVDGGGSVWFFLGDKVNPAFYNDTLAGPARLHGGLLPARLSKLDGDAASGHDVAFVGSVNADHPALASFGEAGGANLSGVTFKSLWRLDATGGDVLMRTNTDLPLLCEKRFGKGQSLVFASTCDRDWTNFPVRPAFLPWLYRLIGHLAQQPLDDQGFFLTGETVSLPTAATSTVWQVRRPDDSLSYAAPAEDNPGRIEFNDTDLPGLYSVSAADAPAVAIQFVTNLESYESDLRFLDEVFAESDRSGETASPAKKIERGFADLLPGNPLVTYVADPTEILGVSQSARRGFKLWDMVLVLVLLLALFEPWFANRISWKTYARSDRASKSSDAKSVQTTAATARV
ncbi:MAG: BatA domain-containing protein [Planctomycetales bacterium]|nr:BatA domain-containing protein [Planctomycetales bacterium]